MNLELENSVLYKDLINVIGDPVLPWEQLKNKKILVSGATGLIGSLLVKTLMVSSEKKSLNLTVGAIVRDEQKALNLFKAYNDSIVSKKLCFEIVKDLSENFSLSQRYDFVIHAASATASKFFIEKPVETILTNVEGTKHLLKLSHEMKVDSFVYISSMEVYGALINEEVKESDLGYLDTTSVRNSYPFSKRLAENLCYSFFSEYQLPIKIVRPTLTFGPGVSKDDNRVFAQFLRSIINRKNIVLNTKGGSKRDYLYTSDAVKGILTILLLGQNGEVYNLSNPDSYCSILDMANLCRNIANNEIEVEISVDEEKAKQYPKEQHIKLNNDKLNSLNKFERTSLKDMFLNLIDYIKD